MIFLNKKVYLKIKINNELVIESHIKKIFFFVNGYTLENENYYLIICFCNSISTLECSNIITNANF